MRPATRRQPQRPRPDRVRPPAAARRRSRRSARDGEPGSLTRPSCSGVRVVTGSTVWSSPSRASRSYAAVVIKRQRCAVVLLDPHRGSSPSSVAGAARREDEGLVEVERQQRPSCRRQRPDETDAAVRRGRVPSTTGTPRASASSSTWRRSASPVRAHQDLPGHPPQQHPRGLADAGLDQVEVDDAELLGQRSNGRRGRPTSAQRSACARRAPSSTSCCSVRESSRDDVEEDVGHVLVGQLGVVLRPVEHARAGSGRRAAPYARPARTRCCSGRRTGSRKSSRVP